MLVAVLLAVKLAGCWCDTGRCSLVVLRVLELIVSFHFNFFRSVCENFVTSSNCKKRKYEDENRNFKPEREEDFAFTVKGGKPLCLICNVSLSHYKASNLKCHYETNHKNFSSDYPPKSELRKNKLNVLKSSLNSQQTLLTTFSKEADTTTEASSSSYGVITLCGS